MLLRPILPVNAHARVASTGTKYLGGKNGILQLSKAGRRDRPDQSVGRTSTNPERGSFGGRRIVVESEDRAAAAGHAGDSRSFFFK